MVLGTVAGISVRGRNRHEKEKPGDCQSEGWCEQSGTCFSGQVTWATTGRPHGATVPGVGVSTPA